jgi:hypothetical protein
MKVIFLLYDLNVLVCGFSALGVGDVESSVEMAFLGWAGDDL